MLVAEMIASALVDAEFPNVFLKVSPGHFHCEEPIVLFQSGFEREGRSDGEERGTVHVSVFVVHELPAEAESVAIAAEKCIRDADWEAFAEFGPWRIAGLDTSAPELSERDSSGRYVWRFEVDATVVRTI